MSGAAPSPGHDRLVLIVGGSDDHLGGVEAFCQRSATALTEHGGWRIERIFASTAYLSWSRLPAFLRGLRSLVRHRRSRPDIVWVQYVNLPDLAYLVFARLLGLRVMVTPHLGVNWRSQHDAVLRGLSRATLRLAHRLALISWTQEKEIALPAGVPRSLIRNFLPLEILHGPIADPATLPDALQLIHSSRLSEGKGTFQVVEVCRRLREAGVPFQARITGTGSPDTMRRLAALVAKHGLDDRVAILGRIPEPELLDLLRRSDVLVHLSSIDSYPLIVLEAVACSVVPVVRELAGARNMVETYGGHIAPAENAAAETAAWLIDCDLPAMRGARGTVAARLRADYDWRRCAAALDAALSACVRGDDHVVTEPEPVALLP